MRRIATGAAPIACESAPASSVPWSRDVRAVNSRAGRSPVVRCSSSWTRATGREVRMNQMGGGDPGRWSGGMGGGLGSGGSIGDGWGNGGSIGDGWGNGGSIGDGWGNGGSIGGFGSGGSMGGRSGSGGPMGSSGVRSRGSGDRVLVTCRTDFAGTIDMQGTLQASFRRAALVTFVARRAPPQLAPVSPCSSRPVWTMHPKRHAARAGLFRAE